MILIYSVIPSQYFACAEVDGQDSVGKLLGTSVALAEYVVMENDEIAPRHYAIQISKIR